MSTNAARITIRGATMETRTRVLFAVGVACVLAVLTGLLLLSGNVGAAIWMEGPYFPLTLLLPGSIDRLATMLVVVALYYFVCSLVALKYYSRRALVLAVLVVVAVNSLGGYVWHRSVDRSASASSPSTRLEELP
jgi:hypothetical protein